MTPDQLKARQLASGPTAPAAPVKIAPEMRELLVRQAAEAAAAQTGAEIDAHNARIELRERHAEEAKRLHEKVQKQASANETLKAAAAAHDDDKHEKHKSKGHK